MCLAVHSHGPTEESAARFFARHAAAGGAAGARACACIVCCGRVEQAPAQPTHPHIRPATLAITPAATHYQARAFYAAFVERLRAAYAADKARARGGLLTPPTAAAAAAAAAVAPLQASPCPPPPHLLPRVQVQDGVFGAMMNVSLVNDGPVTFVLDTREGSGAASSSSSGSLLAGNGGGGDGDVG